MKRWLATLIVALALWPTLVFAGPAAHEWVGLTDANGNSIATIGGAVPVTEGTSASGVTPVVSTTLETAHVLKASGGSLIHLAVVNRLTSPVYVLVMNSATDPGNGAVTPLWFQELPAASASLDTSASWSWGGTPLKTTTGITVVCSTTGPFTETQTPNCGFSGSIR